MTIHGNWHHRHHQTPTSPTGSSTPAGSPTPTDGPAPSPYGQPQGDYAGDTSTMTPQELYAAIFSILQQLLSYFHLNLPGYPQPGTGQTGTGDAGGAGGTNGTGQTGGTGTTDQTGDTGTTTTTDPAQLATLKAAAETAKSKLDEAKTKRDAAKTKLDAAQNKRDAAVAKANSPEYSGPINGEAALKAKVAAYKNCIYLCQQYRNLSAPKDMNETNAQAAMYSAVQAAISQLDPEDRSAAITYLNNGGSVTSGGVALGQLNQKLNSTNTKYQNVMKINNNARSAKQAYNDALTGYNDAVTGYNNALTAFNTARDAYVAAGGDADDIGVTTGQTGPGDTGTPPADGTTPTTPTTPTTTPEQLAALKAAAQTAKDKYALAQEKATLYHDKIYLHNPKWNGNNGENESKTRLDETDYQAFISALNNYKTMRNTAGYAPAIESARQAAEAARSKLDGSYQTAASACIESIRSSGNLNTTALESVHNANKKQYDNVVKVNRLYTGTLQPAANNAKKAYDDALAAYTAALGHQPTDLTTSDISQQVHDAVWALYKALGVGGTEAEL